MGNRHKRILYISGSIGLGHVLRDIAIARELRNIDPDVEIEWIADEEPLKVLKDRGEKLVTTDSLPKFNEAADMASKDYTLDFAKGAGEGLRLFVSNVEIYRQILGKGGFDLVVGDEAYDYWIYAAEIPELCNVPFIMMFDFVGYDVATNDPEAAQLVDSFNRSWYQDMLESHRPATIFIGELEDIPDRRLGPSMPKRRDMARKYYDVVGYILVFDPTQYHDKDAMRRMLGYGEEKLIICTIGGTSTGVPLLYLCAKAFPKISESIKDVRMILVTGPRCKMDTSKIPDGVEVVEYIPELYKHLAASDVVVTSGGGTTTLELIALQKPFIYFPFEHDFEQEVHVAWRNERLNAGIKMKYSATSPDNLADTIVGNIDKGVSYPPIRLEGAKNAALVIDRVLREQTA